MPLSNQKYEIKLNFINRHPNEYCQEFHYYPFTVKLDKFFEVVILSITYLIKYSTCVFNMITRINESKALTKHISHECKCKFDERKCNSNQ